MPLVSTILCLFAASALQHLATDDVLRESGIECVADCVGGKRIYVDPKSTAAKPDGTEKRPYADLQLAIDAGIKWRRKHLEDPIDVVLAGGDYLCAEPIVIGALGRNRLFGSLKSPFVIRAADGASPRLLGAVAVSGWQKTSFNGRSDVWVADLSKLNVTKRLDLFFFDGHSMMMCRYPNADPAHPYSGGWAYVDGEPIGMYKESPDDSDSQLKAKPEDIRNWSNPSEGRVNIFPRYNWWNTIQDIASVSQNLIVFASPIRGTGEFPTRPFDRYHLMGLREELDASGEWYHDQKADKLYFIPPAGVDPNSKVASIPLGEAVISIKSSTNVVIRGLEICSAAAGIVAKGRGDSHYCRVENCRIHDIGFFDGSAVSLFGTHNAVIDCDIWNIGGQGISFGTTPAFSEPPTPESRDCNLAFNNYIHHTGVVNRHGYGIFVRGQGSRVTHNLIHDMPRGGIFYSGRFLSIDHNRVRHTNTEMEDTAAIYGGGYCNNVGTKIAFNHISYSYSFGHDADGVYDFRIHNAWGVYIDECAGGTEVVGNLIDHCSGGGVHIHSGRYNIVSNNVFISNANQLARTKQHSMRGWKPDSTHLSDKAQREYEKLVDACPDWKRFPSLAHPPKSPEAPDGLVMVGNQVVNNIWYYPDQPKSYALFVGNFNHRNNLFDRNIYWPGRGRFAVFLDGKEMTTAVWRNKMSQDRSSLVADPKFTAPEKGDRSFKPRSPAVKLGIWPLPVDTMGLVATKYRTTRPVEAEGVREHPEWLTTATSVPQKSSSSKSSPSSKKSQKPVTKGKCSRL